MVQVVMDILNLYIAMLLHYILKWPYALKVIFVLLITATAVYISIKVTLFVIRKWGLPLLFIILRYFLYLLQLIALAIVKTKPDFRERLEKFDEKLNSLGLKLDDWQERAEIKIPVKVKKILMAGFGILFFASIIFIVFPYYMEPLVTGNSKDTCAKINKFTGGVEEKIQEYADYYYIPVIKVENEYESEVKEEEIEMPESAANVRYVLHLGVEGYYGANLRSTPERLEGNVIIVIAGDDEMYYENEIVDDGLITWLKVSTEDIAEAWISKKLIREEDLETAGIE